MAAARKRRRPPASRGAQGSRQAPGLLVGFVRDQWLLLASGAGLLLTSAVTGRVPSWSAQEGEVLLILSVLFVSVNGLINNGMMAVLARKLERGRAVPLKLVLLTFLLSMLVTNDVALMVMVPLVMSLGVERKGAVVILEALAANAGSALTPFGNPQNLFIYWSYGVTPAGFIMTMAPFSLGLLVVLAGMAMAVDNGDLVCDRGHAGAAVAKRGYVFIGLLVMVVLSVLRVLPLVCVLLVLPVAAAVDRSALRIDWPLLLSFLFFFVVADNLKLILAPEIGHSGNVFLLSAMASQMMSNVPAALLFARFTENWQALLWGVNAGGFGSLFGSLANLIAYRIYVAGRGDVDPARFTLWFLGAGYLMFFLSIGLFFATGAFLLPG